MQITNQPAFLVTQIYASGSSLQTKLQTMLQARKQEEQKIFQQNVDYLLLTSRPRTIPEEETEESSSPESGPAFTLAERQLPGFISNHLKNYRSRIEEAADNLRYYKETINYLQERVDELKNALSVSPDSSLLPDAGIRLEAYQCELEGSYQGAADVLSTQLSCANGFVSIVKPAYGEEIYEQLSDAMGDFFLETSGSSYDLSEAGHSTREVTAAIDSTVRKLEHLSLRIAGRFQEYTGNPLPAFPGRNAADIAASARKFVDEHLTFPLVSENVSSPGNQAGADPAARYHLYNTEPDPNENRVHARA